MGIFDNFPNNLYEFADHRDRFAVKTGEQAINVFEHLLLVIWCKHNYNHPLAISKEHWKSEILAFLKYPCDTKLKQGEKLKKRVLVDELLNRPDFIEFEDVYRRFSNLMLLHWRGNSNVNVNDFELTNEMYDDYTRAINDIINICSRTRLDELIKYIDKL